MPYTKLSTSDTPDDGTLSPPISPTTDQSSGHYTTQPLDVDKLLAIDLREHHGDADELYAIAKDFRQLVFDLQTQIVRLKAVNLTKSQSKGSSRRDTDDSDYSLKKGLEDTRIGIAITYDPSDHTLAVRSGEAMKGLKCTPAPLPPFHWWTDTLHIYFSKNNDPNIPGPKVTILEKKLPNSSDLNFIRTIKLGQLGCGIIRRRLMGKIDNIYVLSPESQPARAIEMRTVAEPVNIL